MKKKILLTGASGLVGSHFLDYFNYNQYEVYALYRTKPQKMLGISNESQIIIGDITDRNFISELISYNFEIIIHLAAMTNIKFCEENKKTAYDINVNGTMYLANLARKARAKFVYISTDAVFNGLSTEHLGYKEEDLPNSLNAYGQTKYQGELVVQELLKDFLVIRTNIMVKSKGDAPKSFLDNILFTFKSGKVFSGFKDSYFRPVSVKTLFKCIMNLLENNHSGIFHITSSDLVSKAEFALMIAEHYGFNRSLFKEISIDSIEGMEKYPRNLDLTNEKYKKLFGEIGTVKEQLEATL